MITQPHDRTAGVQFAYHSYWLETELDAFQTYWHSLQNASFSSYCNTVSGIFIAVGVDVEKTPIDTTAVISSDTKVEKVDGEITENGGSVINEEDVSKVSRSP